MYGIFPATIVGYALVILGVPVILWKWIVYPKYRSPLRHLPQAPVNSLLPSIDSHNHLRRTGRIPFLWTIPRAFQDYSRRTNPKVGK